MVGLLVGSLTCTKNFKVLTVRSIFKLQLFRFLLFVLSENSHFYNLLLRPREITHTYGTRRQTYRQPMLSCEVERRGIINQLIQMHSVTDMTEFSVLPLKQAVKKFQKILLQNL